MATRKCGNIYFRKYFMAVRKFTDIFVLLLILMVGSRDTLFLVCLHIKKCTDRPTVAAPKCQPSEEDEPPDHYTVFFFLIQMEYVVTRLDTNALSNYPIHKCVNELSITLI